MTFEEATVLVWHKRDVDEYEDGCIAVVEITLTIGEGCRLIVEAHSTTSREGGIAIRGIEFSADSFCPGWPDATEGIYTDLGDMTLADVLPGVWEVPGYHVAQTCVSTTFTIRLEGLLGRADGDPVEINRSEIVVSGNFRSQGDTELVCPCEIECTGMQCGPDGCGGVCGRCESDETCQDGQCLRTHCIADFNHSGDSAVMVGRCQLPAAACTGGTIPGDEQGDCNEGSVCCIDITECESTILSTYGFGECTTLTCSIGVPAGCPAGESCCWSF